MKLTKLVGLTLASLLLTSVVHAQQPYGGCWHPDKVRNWTPQSDPNAKFNRSRVPLAQRFVEPVPMKANKNQHYGGQVTNASILFPTCSLCPSQGANNFVGYQPTYWQYMDKMVYWAGSASEGIIIPPPAGSTDAAHQSGVKMLGQVFFPPAAYGGNRLWVRQMLEKKDGKYIFAKKLFEIAQYFGFDGWFINEETRGGSTSEWEQFIKEFNEYADAAGLPQMEIQWYEAFVGVNSTILKTHKNTSQFIDYGQVKDYRSYASQLGCTEAQTMEKIYGGIETVMAGLTGYGSTLRSVFKKDGHVGSVALFCPEEHIWKDNVKTLLNTVNNQGEQAYQAMTRTFNNEATVWVNSSHDPSLEADPSGGWGGWPGISGCLIERSAISSMPFITSFCVGIGKKRFVKGVEKNQQDWYHSGVQSVMPTWRWWISQKDGLDAYIDWDEAYNFGNSIKIEGSIQPGEHLVRLYKTQIKVDNGGKLRLVYKTSLENSVEVRLGTESDVNNGMVTLSGATKTESNGWTVDEYDLTQVNGKTIYMVALNIKNASVVSNYKLQLGELALLPANYAPKAMEISNLKNETTLLEAGGDLRITWDWADNADLDHFDVYTVTANGTEKLVGQTRDEAFYVPKFARNETDEYVNVRVVPVMKDGTEKDVQVLKVDYPKLTAPTITVKTSKGYAKVGDVIVLSAKGTGKPTAWKWKLPSSLEPVGGSSASLTTPEISVKALKEGQQKVTIEATNSVGISSKEVTVCDVMNEAEFKQVKNVALKKSIQSFSASTNEKETPKNIIDGVQSPYSYEGKWCCIGTDHNCVIDLQGSYRIYGFKIFDCKAGPENNENFDKYRIMLSEDGVNWTTAVDETGRERDNVKTDNIAPMRARYVKLNPYSEEGMTFRIWEFEVFGADFSNMTMTAPEQLILNAGETQTVTVKYDLNGDIRSSLFNCKASVMKGQVTIGALSDDAASGTITFPVTASNTVGTSVIKVTIDNGGAVKERSISVIVDDPTAKNILSGMEAELRKYAVDYSPGAAYDKFSTDKLTDGNTTEEALGVINSSCKNKQDFWAVFQASDMWNLSKIKISIPNNNRGESDNEVEGLVNKTIEVMVSNNGVDWETVHSFDDLGEVSTLQYYLPKARKTKYLAIVSTLNPFFFPSISEIEAFEQAKSSTSSVVPLKVKQGWNADVIVEAKTAHEHANSTLDKQGWVFYTSGVQEKGAISDETGVVTTTSGNEYQLADYTANNALVLKTTFTWGLLEFEQPQNAEELHILATSTNGESSLMAIPIYDDGGQGTTERFNVDDWFGNSTGTALWGLGRIKKEKGGGFKADDIDGRYEFRLFEHKMPVDGNRKIQSLKFRSTNAGYVPTILAISMKPAVATGIDNVKSDRSAAVTGIYTIDGIKVNALVKGINIIKLADGTTKKVLVR